MRAILIEKAGAFKIIELPVPAPGPGEVLVEMKVMALCNQHDLKVNRGLYRDLVYLEYGVPGFPGHEGAGVVTAVGREVAGFAAGDHVVMSGLGGPPLYAEYVTRKADQIVRVDPAVPLEQVAMSELFGCVHRAVRKVADYTGRSVAVFGCGAAGLAAIQLVRVLGAREVIGLDVAADRLQLARELGADQVVAANDAAGMERLRRTGADIVIECSGHKAAYAAACHIARQSLVIFGYAEGLMEVPLWPLFDHELTIHNSKWLTNEDLTAVVRLIESGRIRTDRLISRRLDFTGYPEAVAAVGRGEIIKAVMTP
ncbi:MAG: zinc-binding dehydrogenase [Opitutaceae bacterium]|nr:zinc-binding dehydrogenase [Opitutaceae bacterium]